MLIPKKDMMKVLIITTLFTLNSCVSSIRFAHEPIDNDFNSTSSEDTLRLKEISFIGLASYYSDRFHGSKTASGEIYDKNDFTAAHRSLPFGTKVIVTNLENMLTVLVRINDRGPHKQERIIDLSRAAAEKIDMIKAGIVKVKITYLE